MDRETGQVTLIRARSGDDAGQPIHPVMLDGQVNGGSAHMTGHALLEESLYDEKGRMLNYSWRDYKQPTALDTPEYIVDHVHTHDPYGPFGAKGAGEASSCSSLAAIANGVYDAVGVRIKDLPITAEKILAELKKKGGKVMFIRRLPPFDYHTPASLPEALKLLSTHGKDAKLLAGGTDLILAMKKHTVAPAHLINLKTIPGLSGITADSGGVTIGALTTMAEIERSAIIKETYTPLWDAACVMASPQVRTLATIGGNLVSAVPSADTAPPLMVLSAQAHITGPAG